MSLRPRPVTATVTKPRWMGMPDAEAIAHARRHSLGSTGSTASLVSVLDHDSYMSVPSDSELEAPKVQLVRKRSPKRTKVMHKGLERNEYDRHARVERRSKSASSDEKNLSPWETWLIRKTQEEREKRQHDSQKKRQDKSKKMEEEREKVMKEQKAQQVRSEWTERKDYEEMLRKKLEKQKIRNDKKDKEDKERRINEKSTSSFKMWTNQKREEERAMKRSEKERKRQEEEEKNRKKEEADRKFHEWLKVAAKRPKSAPSSQGYMDGKLKGSPRKGRDRYHDTGAYPKPSFYNPVPWQPIPMPKVKSEKPKRSKAKKYVWNPNKYY